jgi:hypothetical protein
MQMPYPRKESAVFKVLVGLHLYGDMTVDEIIDKVGYVTERPMRYAISQLMSRMVTIGYVTCNAEKYTIVPDVKSYVEDMLEITKPYKKKELVASPYRNVFTNEMKNYNLFANKRGY